jgi:hypothetical protein
MADILTSINDGRVGIKYPEDPAPDTLHGLFAPLSSSGPELGRLQHFYVDSKPQPSPKEAEDAFRADYHRQRVPSGGVIYWRNLPEMYEDKDFDSNVSTWRVVARFTIEHKPREEI